MVIDVLRGSRSQKVLARFGTRIERGTLPSFGAAAASTTARSVGFWRALHSLLLRENLIAVNDASSKWRTFRVAERGRTLLADTLASLVLVPTKELQSQLSAAARRRTPAGWDDVASIAATSKPEEQRRVVATAVAAAPSRKPIAQQPTGAAARTAARAPASARAALDAGSEALHERLQSVVDAIAAENNVAAYMVLAHAALRALCVERPTTTSRLLKVEGVTAAFVRRHGAALCTAVRTFCAIQTPSLATDIPIRTVSAARVRVPAKSAACVDAHALHAQGMSCARIASVR